MNYIPPVGQAFSPRVRREISIDSIMPGRIYFQRYLVTSIMSEQGGMSTVYKAIDLFALKKLDTFKLASLGFACLRNVDLSKQDSGELLPSVLGLKINGEADLNKLEDSPLFKDYRVVLKCSEGKFRVKALEREMNVLYDMTTEEKQLPREGKMFPRLVGYGVIPDSSPDENGHFPTYLAMEEAGSIQLRRFIRDHGATLYQTIAIFEQILIALKRLHETRTENNEFKGYLHRDLKEQNIMVILDLSDANGKIEPLVKLIDFGVTSSSEENNDGTRVSGTLTNMAPELFYSSTLDIKVDIYALGILLYKLIAYGNNPMRGEDAPSTVQNHLSKQMPPLPVNAVSERFEDESALRYGPTINKLHATLDHLIQGTTRKKKADRFGDIDALLKIVAKARSLAAILEKEETIGMIVNSEVIETNPSDDLSIDRSPF